MTGIVILNYNNTNDIIVCVKSLLDYLDTTTIKIVVVDNGSKMSVREKVRQDLYNLFPSSFATLRVCDISNIERLTAMTYITSDKNLGYAKGNNIGISAILKDSEVSEILVLNSDIIFTENILPPLLSVLNEREGVGSISPMLRRLDGSIDYCCARRSFKKEEMLITFSNFFNKKYHLALETRKLLKQEPNLAFQDVIDIDLPSGSCMLFKKSVMESLGGFDEGTFLYYEEDILSKKIKALGLTNLMVPGTSCVHLGGATTNKTKSAYFLKKCNYDSLLYYLQKYESCTTWELLYFKVTAWMHLSRLWFGMLYHRIIN